MEKNSLMLIDGMSLLFRGYYATAYTGKIRRTKEGTPTNGIHGFVRYMWDAIQTFEPTHVVCCWDMGGKTFRTDLYDQYKQNRMAPPEDLMPQFGLVKDVVESLGIPNIGQINYEADDIIGSMCKQYQPRINMAVLTSDQDSLQLVDERTKVIIMKKGMSNYKVYTPEILQEEKGLSASQIIDLKGLMGDTSDNYPGVKGIGEKTAIKLLNTYNTIEGILNHLTELPNGVRTKIEKELDMLHLSKQLATIKCDIPIALQLEEMRLELEYERIEAQFHELEFHSLLGMIEKEIDRFKKISS